jgi:hypothetical protein
MRVTVVCIMARTWCSFSVLASRPSMCAGADGSQRIAQIVPEHRNELLAQFCIRLLALKTRVCIFAGFQKLVFIASAVRGLDEGDAAGRIRSFEEGSDLSAPPIERSLIRAYVGANYRSRGREKRPPLDQNGTDRLVPVQNQLG